MDVTGRVGTVDRVERSRFRLDVVKDRLVKRAEPLSCAVGPRPAPDNLVLEVMLTKDGVEGDLEIVPGRRVAMQV